MQLTTRSGGIGDEIKQENVKTKTRRKKNENSWQDYTVNVC